MTSARATVARAQSDVALGEWLVRIRAEYLEVPGLHLTLPEAQRLWGLDEITSAALFAALVDVKFLRRTHTGAYVRAGAY